MQPALQLALLVAIILPAVKIAASVCGRLGIPPILGELLVGVALGPGLVDLLHLRVFTGGEATGTLMILAQLGGYLLMFIAGVETDIERMRKACVTAFFVVGYAAAKRWLDAAMQRLRKLDALEGASGCVLALVLLYAISAEWLGSVAGITGAYLLGYVFAGSRFKSDIERSFHAIGHGLLIPLFFVSIGLISDYRALAGHWGLLFVVLVVAVAGKLVGCGLAARVCGMDAVRSLRVGCGMISRGEVGLIVTSMGAASGMFGRSEVALMVAVVLLTTLLTPIALRGTFEL